MAKYMVITKLTLYYIIQQTDVTAYNIRILKINPLIYIENIRNIRNILNK